MYEIHTLRDGLSYPRYHPHWLKAHSPHNAVSAFCPTLFRQTAPECSHLQFLLQCSQSVTPVSCQVPCKESLSLPFLISKADYLLLHVDNHITLLLILQAFFAAIYTLFTFCFLIVMICYTSNGLSFPCANIQ